jgi:hypothetical protein
MYCSRAGGARFSSSHLVNSTFYHTNLLAAYLLFFEEDGYEIRAVKDRQFPTTGRMRNTALDTDPSGVAAPAPRRVGLFASRGQAGAEISDVALPTIIALALHILTLGAGWRDGHKPTLKGHPRFPKAAV